MPGAGNSGIFKSAALAAVVALGGIAPQQLQAENMADALVGAYNTSGLLEQNRAVLRAADEDVALAVAALRPVIAWSTSILRDWTDSNVGGFSTSRQSSNFFSSVTFELLIYDGGAGQLGSQAAKETVLATRQTLVAIEQQILLRAVAAYMNVLLAGENVILRQNNVRVLSEELRAAQDRFEVGEVTRTDVALAESRQAAARSSLASARGEVVRAKAEYTNAVGHKPGTLAGQPKLPQRAASIASAEALAVRNHPSVLSAQHQVSAAELTVQRTTKTLGPSASVRADIGMTETWGSLNHNYDGGVSLTFRQPLYQGGALAAGLRRSMAARDSSRANLLNVQRDVIQGVNNAFVRLEVARASLVATEERVRAAQVAFDGIREEATLGARTTLDVLTAEQELLNAQTSRISDLAERSIASYELLATQGLLTAERLGLAVQIYDPTIYYNLVKTAPANLSRQSRDLNRIFEAMGKR
ncbi:MAG: outer membrane protein [Paracoccaceae bacterium]|jgi:outer membrane protein